MNTLAILLSDTYKQIHNKIYPKGLTKLVSYHKHHGWNTHWASTVPDQRKSITPEEIVEVRNEYGITLKSIKPKRKIDPWDYEKESKVSGWKMQSKRRKQWKPMEGI